MTVKHAKELVVHQREYEFAMRLFELRFPPEERFALTSQIRRSSRSICRNLREAWAKRRYPAHFISKLTASDGELNESDTSLDFARECKYITLEQHPEFSEMSSTIGKMLGSMIRNPEPFLFDDPTRST